MRAWMSTEAINNHIEDIYHFSVSKEQISRVTDKILPIAFIMAE